MGEGFRAHEILASVCDAEGRQQQYHQSLVLEFRRISRSGSCGQGRQPEPAVAEAGDFRRWPALP
jgi:hypothetical protein